MSISQEVKNLYVSVLIFDEYLCDDGILYIGKYSPAVGHTLLRDYGSPHIMLYKYGIPQPQKI